MEPKILIPRERQELKLVNLSLANIDRLRRFGKTPNQAIPILFDKLDELEVICDKIDKIDKTGFDAKQSSQIQQTFAMITDMYEKQFPSRTKERD